MANPFTLAIYSNIISQVLLTVKKREFYRMCTLRVLRGIRDVLGAISEFCPHRYGRGNRALGESKIIFL